MKLERLKFMTENVKPHGGVSLAPSQCGLTMAVEPETGLLLYALVTRLHPLRVVECGTYRGYSSAWIACALDDAGYGRLYTVDRDDLMAREHVWRPMEIDGIIDQHIGNSWDAPYPFEEPIDFLWLDADHAGASIIKEFFHFLPYFNDECLIGFHDTWFDARMHRGIEVIKEFCGVNPQHFAFRNMRGVDFVQCLKGGAKWREDHAQASWESMEQLREIATEEKREADA